MDIFTKDPASTLDFALDWSNWVQTGDSVIGAQWVAPDGLTVATTPAPSITSNKATVWLSGGTLGQLYTVTCRITTAQGRMDKRAIAIRIAAR